MRNAIHFIFFLFLCGLTTPSLAGISHDPNLDWSTLKSDHFHIHFHQGEEQLARQALAIAERVHDRLSKFMQWTPRDATDIILTDEFDASNGYATPVPSNRMALYISAPDDIRSLEDHSGWLETLITHEYLHILHLDKKHGFPATLQKIFGRFFLLFPNSLQPAWLVEGLATYIETDKDRGVGRGQSSYFDMLMRMEVANGIKPLRQVNQPIASWPGGATRYLYGVNFYQFIEARKGKNKINQLINNYSDNLIPFRINSNSAQVLGKQLTPLWNEFEQYLKEKHQPQLTALKERGEITGKQLTHDGYFAGPIRALPDGRVFYLAYDGQRRPRLMLIKGQQAPVAITDVNFGTRLDVHPQAGILLAQPERCHNAALYYDLYHIDPNSGDETRLTHCGRYRHATWSADGTRIAAVKNALGQNSLQLLDAKGQLIETLWDGGDNSGGGEVISQLDWSPDNRTIVASVWRPKTGWNLERFDLKKRTWTALTKDSTIENHPQFSADGKSILYTSDHGGIYNIRRMNLASGKNVSLTDVPGGAFHPAQVGNDGALFYAGYGPKGFDIYRLEDHSKPRKLPFAKEGPSAIPEPSAPAVATSSVEEYTPWRSLRPQWWLPHLLINDQRTELGAVTAGWDTLMRHIYTVDIAYDVENSWWLGSLNYIYDRWYPIFKLHADREVDIYLGTNDTLLRSRLSDTLQAEMVLPFFSVNNRLSIHLGAVKEQDKDDFVAAGQLSVATAKDNLLGVALVYDSTTQHPKSISRAEGREISLIAEDSDTFSGSTYTGEVYTADWREFIRLGGAHVLALRAVMAKGTRSPRQFRLGGTSDTSFTPPILASTVFNSPFNRRDYALRGYPEGLSQLRGKRMQLASIEYRFPLWLIERGFMAPPVGLHQLHGTVFIDSGAAWQNGSSPDKHYTGAGLEVFADTVLLYGLKFKVTLGLAHGFDDVLGEDKVYLRLGTAF